MTDFETLVRSMMKNGATAEDIAKMTSDTLNIINEEKVKEKQKHATARQAALEHYRDVFNKSYEKGTLDISDCATLCVLVCAGSYPHWGPDEFEQFHMAMNLNIRAAASIVGKNPGGSFANLFNDVFEAVTDGVKDTPKTKEDKKTAAPTASSNPCPCKTRKMTPEEIIKKFIESF